MQLVQITRSIGSKIDLVSRILGIIAIGVLVVMMLFTVLNVVMRGAFNAPIPGDVELIEVWMVCVGFLGLAWCAIRGMHVKVDLIVSRFPRRVQAAFDIFSYLLGLGITVLLSYRAFVEGVANREMNNLSSTLRFPIYNFYWVVGIGYAGLCLALLVLLARSVLEVGKK